MSLLGTLADKEVNNFLRTVTIKNTYFATRSRNRQMRVNSTSVPDNIVPYYRHIAGEYILKEPVTCQVKNPKTGLYESQTYGNTALVTNGMGYQNREVKNTDLYEDTAFDEMMYVTSLDTGEEIPFTLENLHPEFASDASAVHTKTLAAYKVPSRLHDLLCEKYPAQVDLIKAIVYPVTGVRGLTDVELNEFENNGEPLPDYKRRRRDALVSANDFSLLACDETILEELERHDLITHAKLILRNLDKRWNIQEFWKEQNYPLVLWAIVWCALRLGLIIRRYENIKTQFAHSSHVWDYLESKGLEPYRGYLTTAQTKFLYKNIEYILRNRGKQKVTNILVDEFLSDIGLNLKTKTVVLDTTATLDTSKLHHISEVKTQCRSCSRASYCHKNITNFECPNYLNTSGLCEAQPIILTEEFVGARKSKIISALINQYGYTEAEAKTKYERSIIWKDDEVEAIRSDYDRDQLTDVNGPIESLDTLIQREYASGLEPEYSENVVDQQTKELQHIAGTVAPTKLIELTRNRPQPKYQSLFNKFLTETLLHLAPRLYTYVNANGHTVTEKLEKVSTSYNLTFRNVSMNCRLEFGQLLAMMYMGVMKENEINLFFDHCTNDTAYGRDRQYFRFGWGEEELETVVNASRLIPLIPGDYVIGGIVDSSKVFVKNDQGRYVQCVDQFFLEDKEYYKRGETAADFILMESGDYVPGDPIDDERVYQWAPWKGIANGTSEYEWITGLIDKAAGHEPLTDFHQMWTYDFPIPYQARLKTTFKFGKPVPQQALVDAWLTDEETSFDYEEMIPAELLSKFPKAVKVNDMIYVVSEIEQDAPEMWDGWSVALKIEGIIKNNAFFYARDEIAIIPKYARWYSDHLVPDDAAHVTTSKQVTLLNTDLLPLDENVEGDESPRTSMITIQFDANKGKTYIPIEIEKYFDLDAFLNGYVDLMENVTTQEQIGEYLTKMFTLLERTYAYGEGSPRAETQIAAKAVLEACLHNIQNYRFDLTGGNKTAQWIPDGITKYKVEHAPIQALLFGDWLKRTDNLMDICDVVDANTHSTEIWSEFNSDCIKKVLDFCTLPYVETSDNIELAKKMRKLVASLSSYKIAFIDGDETERYTDSPVAVVDGSAECQISVVDKDYVSPIMDSVCNPHVACYEVAEDGCIMMRTPDTHAREGVVYYEVVTTQYVDPDLDDSESEVSEEDQSIDVVDTLNLDTVTYRGVAFEEGTLLTPNTYYEKIDVKQILKVSGVTSILEFKKENGKWMVRIGAAVQGKKVMPSPSCRRFSTITPVLKDYKLTYTSEVYSPEKTQDAFISSLKLEDSQRKKLVTYKYRHTINVNDYGWTAWMEIPPVLADYMSVFSMARTIYVHDKTGVDIIVENGDSIVDEQWRDDAGTDELPALRQYSDRLDPVPTEGVIRYAYTMEES